MNLRGGVLGDWRDARRVCSSLPDSLKASGGGLQSTQLPATKTQPTFEDATRSGQMGYCLWSEGALNYWESETCKCFKCDQRGVTSKRYTWLAKSCSPYIAASPLPIQSVPFASWSGWTVCFLRQSSALPWASLNTLLLITGLLT